MGFWIFMLVMCLLIPVSMILLGCRFYKKAPRNINPVFGYRSERSMKNAETWQYAHRLCGRLWMISGCAALAPAAALLFFIGDDAGRVGIAGGAVCFAQLVCMICPVFFVESALKKRFDRDGNRIESQVRPFDD